MKCDCEKEFSSSLFFYFLIEYLSWKRLNTLPFYNVIIRSFSNFDKNIVYQRALNSNSGT